MNEVPFGLTRKVPDLGFIVWYRSEPEVLKNQFLPVWVRGGRLGDSYYLRSRFPGLASWPSQSPRVGI
jgi:hypothetical protein